MPTAGVECGAEINTLNKLRGINKDERSEFENHGFTLYKRNVKNQCIESKYIRKTLDETSKKKES